MVVTGAGPGIMAAGIEGAGASRSFGVNIRLPHEQGANPFIAQDPKLVEMRYFFTRKLMLIKESDGYAVLPGGFGTLDECYELLTLLQTGKAEPAPVVLLETPGGTYWRGGASSSTRGRRRAGYVSPEDLLLYRIVTSVDDAAARDPRLLPQLPLVPLGGRPARAAPPGRPDPRSSWPSSTAQFADIVASGTIRPPSAFPPERSDNDQLELPGSPCASTGSTTAGCAS